jgi:hypothetical protein
MQKILWVRIRQQAKKKELHAHVLNIDVTGLHGYYVEGNYCVYVGFTCRRCRSGCANVFKYMNVVETETAPI